MSRPTVAALIVAAGSGARLGEGLPKQYRDLAGEPILRRTLRAFAAHDAIDHILVVIHPDFHDHFTAAVDGLPRILPAVSGGATRQSSVRAGLEALATDAPDLVLIHDAARPFIAADVISRAIAALADHPAVLAAVPVVDTLKRTDAAGVITATVPREAMWAAQTPQGFRFPLIRAAHRQAAEAGRHDFTDDAAVAEWAGTAVVTIAGDAGNGKITTMEDFRHAERRVQAEDMLRRGDIRVGTGYDVHAFEPGDQVTLCGVTIAHEARLNGHSDADVALHALTDAILGALGDGDIGSHFPPSDMRWRGAASEIFVRHAMTLLHRRGGSLAHADISLIAEAPKIGPHREAMRARVAGMLGVPVSRVGVKATTNERLGFVGRREGIAAIATATIRLPWDD